MNNFPFEGYYILKNMIKKYFNLIVKPSLMFSFFIGLIYVCIAFLFNWKIIPIVFLVIFLIFLILYIVWGVLHGENQKKFYLKDD